jgi:hypothetical protein
MSIASGFFNTAADRVTERKKYIRDKNAKDRDYLMTYGTQAVRKTEEEANKAITIGKLLEGRGMTQENINFVVDTSGPQGLAILYNTIKDFKPNELSTKQLNEYVKMAEDYRPSGTTYDDMIKKSFGLYKNGVTDNPEKNEERGIWSFLGLDANAADSSMADSYLGGYTGYDLKRIMSSSAPSLKAPLPVDRSLLPRIYSPTEYGRIFNSIEAEILVQGAKYVEGMAGEIADGAYEMDSEEYKKFNLIKDATTNKDTRTLLRELPDAIQAVMDYETKYPNSLSLNPQFSIEYPSFSFGEDAQQIITGADAEPIVAEPKVSKVQQQYYDLALAKDPEMPEINDIPVYTTVGEMDADEDFMGGYVFIGDKLEKKKPIVKTSTLPSMSDSELSIALEPIMKKWDEENPRPTGRALVGYNRKREDFGIEQRKLLLEGKAQASDVSDATGSIVDTVQVEFDKEIKRLVDKQLEKYPEAPVDYLVSVYARELQQKDDKYKDLTPTKIEKD